MTMVGQNTKILHQVGLRNAEKLTEPCNEHLFMSLQSENSKVCLRCGHIEQIYKFIQHQRG
jgi:hypothetical protein